jgi:hypothetical protein
MGVEQEPEFVVSSTSKPVELVRVVARILEIDPEDIEWNCFSEQLNVLEMYLDDRPTEKQERLLRELFGILRSVCPGARLIYPMGDTQRYCPAHGLALRPWHRAGKVECPDSGCMYAEPHICEEFRIGCRCDSSGDETVHLTPRKIPACEHCHIVGDPPPHPAIKVGDAQCSGRCFSRVHYDAWLTWKEEVKKRLCPF